MLAGIRTRDLRKIYNSAPPLASGGGFGLSAGRGKKQESSPNRRLSLSTDSRLRFYPEKSSACWDQTAQASRRP